MALTSETGGGLGLQQVQPPVPAMVPELVEQTPEGLTGGRRVKDDLLLSGRTPDRLVKDRPLRAEFSGLHKAVAACADGARVLSDRVCDGHRAGLHGVGHRDRCFGLGDLPESSPTSATAGRA